MRFLGCKVEVQTFCSYQHLHTNGKSNSVFGHSVSKGTMQVVAICGPGGIRKILLALHCANTSIYVYAAIARAATYLRIKL
jgi:hypothetical protein